MALVRCEYADGLYVEVREYTDEAAFGDRVLESTAPRGDPGDLVLRIGGGRGRPFLSGADSGTHGGS